MNGAKLVYHMRKQNLKNYELAEKLGVTTVYVSYLRTGKNRNPSIELLVRMADVLQTTIDELIREE